MSYKNVFDRELIEKANPYHDKNGRFTTKDKAVSVAAWAAWGSPKKYEAAMGNKETRLKVYKEELGMLKDKGIQMKGYTYKDLTPAEWDAMSGGKVSPKEFVTAMIGRESLAKRGTTGEEEGPVKVIYNPEYGQLSFTALHTKVHGVDVEEVTRRFDLRGKSVDHTFFKVPRDQQGGGVAKRLFKECVPMYRKLGLEKITVHANIDAGGYAWARFGFEPDSPTQARRVHDEFKARTLMSVGNVVDKLSPAAKKEWDVIRGLHDKMTASLDNGGSEWKHIPYTLSRGRYPKLSEELSKIKNPWTDSPILTKSDPGALMRHAMGNANWYGHVRLNDEAQMARLGKYVGIRRPRKKV